MSRETRLTTDIQKKIVAAVKQGNYFCTAFTAAGISKATFYRWMQQGEAEEEGIYRDFRDSIKKAEGESERAAIARIQQAAKGQRVRIQKIREVALSDGSIVPLKETIETIEYSWQADAWYLERKFPDRWGKKRLDVLEALGVLANADWIPPEIVEAAINGLGSARARIKEAFTLQAVN